MQFHHFNPVLNLHTSWDLSAQIKPMKLQEPENKISYGTQKDMAFLKAGK